MTIEEKVLLKLLAGTINNTSVELTEEEKNVNWNIVFKESIAQTIALPIFEAASQQRDVMPSSIYSKWELIACTITANNVRVEENQQEMVDILNKNGYRYAIIKGEAAAAYYRKPEMRQLGDVDFLIDPEQKDQVRAVFEANGFEVSMDTHICHLVLKKPGSHLEMHFEPAGVPNGKAGELVRDALKKAVYTTIEAESSLGRFAILRESLHALVLLLHMQHHILNEGIGLRHLCDWACFIKRTSKKPFWTEELIPLLREIGLWKFTLVITEMCCRYLEVEYPVWLDDEDPEICEQMLMDIMESGNFGGKDKARAQSATLISNQGKDGTTHGKLYYMLYRLKEGYDDKAMLWQKYPITKKIPILYPCFYVLRVLERFNKVFIKEKIPVSKILSQAEQRKELYERLHIFEVKK